MKKRILCLIMSFIMTGLCMSSFTVLGSDEAYTLSHTSQDTKELLSTINIDISHCNDTVSTVSRAEFIYVLMQLVNCADMGGSSLPFDDVAGNDYFSGAVSYALGLNVVSSSSSFYPYREVTVNEACKMAVTLLGGGYLANAKGGYPYGYYLTASQMELLDGITSAGNELLTREEFYTFIKSFLIAKVYEPEQIENDGFLISDNRSILEVYHDVYTVSGIITANENSALYDPAVELGEGFAEIDHTLYKTIVDAPLGAGVTAYVKNTANYDTIIFFDCSDTASVDVDTSYFIAVNSSSVEYETGDKQKKLSLDNNPSFIYNGKADPKFLVSDLKKVDGVVTFTDNNQNGKYDVVEVKESTQIYVQSVNADEKYITGFNAGYIDLGDNSDKKYSVTVDGVPASLSQIPSGTMASCSISKDGMLINISVSTKSVSGTIEGYDYGRKMIYVDGTGYVYGKYFEEYYLNSALLGIKGTFLLSDRDMIEGFVKESKGTMQFGYFIDIKQKSGIDDSIIVKMCTSDDTIATMNMSDDVVLNGIRASSNDDILSLLTTDGEAKSQIIRYSLDKNGAINCIDTKAESAGIMTGDEPENDNLTLYRFPTGTTNMQLYNTSTSIVFPFFAVADDAVAFVVGDDETMEDEKRFRAYNAKSYYSSIDKYVRLDKTEVLNVSPENAASAVVINANVLGVAVSDYTPSGLVYTLTKAMIEDGETCLKLVAVTGNEFKTYYIKDESVLSQAIEGATLENPGIEPGDVLRISAAADGTVAALALDFDYSEETVYKTDSSHNALCTYYYGTVYGYSAGTITAVTDNTQDITNNPMRFVWRVSGTVPVYDAETNNVYHAPIDSVRTYLTFQENCSKVLVRTYNGAVNSIVVYK